MKIERTISFHSADERVWHTDGVKDLTPEERVSLLEELRYDLGEFTGYDYSQRFTRLFSTVEQQQR